MSTQDMLGKYPQMRAQAGPKTQWPDYEPTVGAAAGETIRLAGALSRTLLMVIFSALALAVVIAITLSAVH